MLSTIAALLCVATFSQSVSARKCKRHTDCPTFLPFCYDGTCELCSECEHCWDGIDGTCGGCDKRRFPTDGVKCPPPPRDDDKSPKYPKQKRDEYEEEEEEADFLDLDEEEEAEYLAEQEQEYEAEYIAMEEEEEETEEDFPPRDENEDKYDRRRPSNGNGQRPKGPKMSRKEIMDAVKKQLEEDGVTETKEELETNVDMIVAIQEGHDLEEDFTLDDEEEEDFPVDEEEEEYMEEEMDTDTETAYGQSCEAHSDCPALLPFCYETGDCAPCEECEYLDNGIDGTCGGCGDGYPTMEGGDDDEFDGMCESHDDCSGDEPFCYDGECAPCSECHYCHDGVDNTCGSCGDGFPTREDEGVRCTDPRLYNKKRPRMDDEPKEYFDPASDEAERKYDDAEKRKYRQMIQDQLEEEGDAETEEELATNTDIVARLAKENVKKGKFSDRLADTFDVDIDNDIEMKVIDAIRKAKNENKMGLTERDIGNKLIEGLRQLAGNLLDDEEENFDPTSDEAEREYDADRRVRRQESKSDEEIEAEVIRELKAEDDKRKRSKKQADREDLY